MTRRDEYFGLDLILAEEQGADAQPAPQPDDGQRAPSDEGTSLVHEESDVVRSGSFYVHPDDTGFLVPGPGSLDTLLLLSDSGDYTITIDTESTTLVNDTFTFLKNNSAELSHIAAHERSDGTRVLSIGDFPYRDSISIAVYPGSSITFERIRAVFKTEALV